METIYDIDYFIAKFSAIPERKWTSHKYIKGIKVLWIDFQRKCAQGHCLPLRKDFTIPIISIATEKRFEEWKSLVLLFGGIVTTECFHNPQVADINNGENPEYQQPTPKQRIIAALYDIKKMQEPKPTYENISKSLAILPIDETSDKTSTPKPLKQLQ